MWWAAGETASSAAFPTLLSTGVLLGVVFVFAYRLAVLHRAHSDYKKTKAAVKPLRKARTSAFWATVRFGFWLFIGAAILLGWAASEGHRLAGR
jgi:hypothetical protein